MSDSVLCLLGASGIRGGRNGNIERNGGEMLRLQSCNAGGRSDRQRSSLKQKNGRGCSLW